MVSDEFRDRHGHAPVVTVSAPGRVNLIGEHTDYSLLPVMPFAIDRRVTVAVAPSDGGLTAYSTRFPDAGGSWTRYVRAALDQCAPGLDGVAVVVDGDLPHTGGLSSSSALTVASIAAFLTLTGEAIEPEDLIRRAIDAERSLGVEGGSMDQTVIVAGRRGSALRLEFDPPLRRPVTLPDDLRVVVASSGSSAPKAGAYRDDYNARVVACRLAAVLTDPGGAGKPPILGRVHHGVDPPSLPAMASAAEVATGVGVPLGPLVGLTTGRFDPDRRLPVAAVARHVIDEAARVDEMESALGDGDAVRVGAILDASHASLARFGVSTPGLDSVVVAMRAAGAHGARLTGAGFGGYAVGVCPPGAVRHVIDRAVAATGGPAFEVAASDGLLPA